MPKGFRLCQRVSDMSKGFDNSKYYLYVKVSGFGFCQICFGGHLYLSRTLTIQSETEQPTVLVTTSDLNWRYDAYHCNCGQHSLLHTPGNRCDGASLILDGATDITTSCRHRNVEIISLIFTTQVLS